MKPVIKVENLSKQYILSHKDHALPYSSIREELTNKFRKIYKKNKSFISKEEFWALRDLNFEVNAGDKIGIIGRNGAGKSSLLKILSRITEPSSGKIKIRGRVASLLEVGTGFHPELTGRENIFLNGAILGMSRSEILKKFDQIVDFAEIEKFLDTPVKRYSSGMYVKLAFSVAAHMESEILIVDEVLAVGDAQFQRKCMGTMGAVSAQGRTVLFVSHNMGAIKTLCNKSLLLSDGQIKSYSENVADGIRHYLSLDGMFERSYWENTRNEFNNKYFKPLKFFLCNQDGEVLSSFAECNDDIFIQIEASVEERTDLLSIGYTVFNEDGQIVFLTSHTDEKQEKWAKFDPGIVKIRSKFPKRILNEGSYRIELLFVLHGIKRIIGPGDVGPSLNLILKDGISDSPYWLSRREGVVAPVITWTNL